MPDRTRTAGALLVALILSCGAAMAEAQEAREIVETAVTLDRDAARLELETADGGRMAVSLADGRVYVDGDVHARYGEGGVLQSEWRDLLEAAGEGVTPLAGAWEEFVAREYPESDRAGVQAIRAALAPVLGGEVPAMPEAPGAPATVGARQPSATGEVVSGGLIVEITELQGARETLSRLAPGLPEDLARALEGPLRIVVDAREYHLPAEARVESALLLIDTDATIAGTVVGDLIVAEGSVRLESGARVEGSVISLDGDIRDRGGTITGEVREIDEIKRGTGLRVAPVRVERSKPSFLRHVFRGVGDLVQTLAAFLIWAFLGVLTVYFFRGHLETISDTISYSFGRSFLAGLAAQILFFPILLVLVVLVLTWLAIPFYVVGFGLATLVGYIAVAHAAGENMTRRRFVSWPARLRRSNSYYYVLNGLVILLALFAAAAIVRMGGSLLGWAHGLMIAAAWILSWIAASSGLGAVLLSRAGTRRTFARPREVPDLTTDLDDEPLDDLFRHDPDDEPQDPGGSSS